ncbi:hypothetical protein [Marinifilum flexuosum]|uniref:hypothetical protein n=1 Tax=Marinifilum flexuosum TaxID=1117708 RepID=UPI0024955C11|nr:hypothetical protein [Marinifilum flexuosum]
MSSYIKNCIFILTLFVSFAACSQSTINPSIINYKAICDQNEFFENHSRIKPRIISRGFKDDIYTLELDIYGNCSISDTSWVEYFKDTLHIWTGPIDTFYRNARIIIVPTESNCFYHLSYDIKGLSKEPSIICFNGNELKESNDKFLSEEYITLNEKQYLLFDSKGKYYEYEFYKSGIIKKMRIESGLLAQIWFYSENGKLIEIWTDSRAIPNGKLEKKVVNNGG